MTVPSPLPRHPSDLTAAGFAALAGEDTITSIDVERVGEGFGLESLVARVEAASSSEAAADRVVYACKFCTADNARGERIAFERVLAATGVRRPSFVAAHDDGEDGIVITRFVAGRQGDVLAGCDDTVAADIVASIADLHATWWGRAGREFPELPTLDDRFRRPLSIEQVERCIELHGDLFDERVRRLLRGLPGRVDAVADELVRLPATVVHADLHLDNVIIDDDGAATILDWGRPHRGPAVVDLARCFVEVTDASPDDPRGRDLLDAHAERLAAHGVEIASDRLRDALRAAQLAFAPGIVRWAASGVPRPGERRWSLLRNALSRWSALVQSRPA